MLAASSIHSTLLFISFYLHIYMKAPESTAVITDSSLVCEAGNTIDGTGAKCIPVSPGLIDVVWRTLDNQRVGWEVMLTMTFG